jgi:hypothetical protein
LRDLGTDRRINTNIRDLEKMEFAEVDGVLLALDRFQYGEHGNDLWIPQKMQNLLQYHRFLMKEHEVEAS